MNENTLVTVHCYEGDKQLVENNLPCYLHHGSPPVIIMSPQDSAVIIPGLICRFGGQRAYIGQASLDRQRLHLSMALEYQYRYYLLNDADSLCVSPEIPKYLYDQSENTIWANIVHEPRPHASKFPKLALQPPYFLERATLIKMLSVADQVTAHPITPYIDHYMLELACMAGVNFRSYMDMETPAPVEIPTDTYTEMSKRIRYHGRVMLHPVKTPDSLAQWREDYRCRIL